MSTYWHMDIMITVPNKEMLTFMLYEEYWTLNTRRSVLLQ
jgi:hypothetical protein